MSKKAKSKEENYYVKKFCECLYGVGECGCAFVSRISMCIVGVYSDYRGCD